MVKEVDNTKQMFLSFLFTFVLVIGFIGTASITNYYETTGINNVLLYETDSTTKAGLIPFSEDFPPYPLSFVDYQHSQLQLIGGNWNQYNRTPSYTGNGNFSMAVNTSGAGVGTNLAQYVFELPNIDTWLIDYINITMSTNAELDNRLILSLIYITTTYPIDDVSAYTIVDNILLTGTSPLDLQFDLTPLQTQQVFSESSGHTEFFILFQYLDSTSDGMVGFAWDMNFEIHGTTTGGWSMDNAITAWLVINIIALVIVIVYAQDRFDVGGFVRDLPKRRK